MKSNIRLLFLLMIVFLFSGIFQRLHLPPQSVHQWAQCDRLSVAWNFYNGKVDFFHPEVNNQDNLTGITGLEFPIIQFVVAQVAQLTGFHEIVYRLLTLMVFTFGLLAVYRIAVYFTGSTGMGMFTALFVSASPLLQFYGFNFLPDIYAFSFVMISWWYWLQYSDHGQSGDSALAFLFFILAGLLKPTSLINALPMLVWLLSSANARSRLRLYSFRSFVFFGMSSGIVVCWYAYASWLSEKYHSEVFLMHLRPPVNFKQIMEIWEVVEKDWLKRIYEKPFLCILLFGSVITAARLLLKRDRLALLFWSSLIATLIYLWLMWLQMAYHDYYAITAMPFFVFAIILLMRFLNKVKSERWGFVLLVFSFIILGHQFYQAKTHIRTCYNKDDWKYGSVFFDRLLNAENSLRRAGVGKDEAIISLFDHTPNVSLYLLHRPGVAVGFRNSDEVLMAYLNRGVYKHLVINRASINPEFPFVPSKFPVKETYVDSLIIVYTPNAEFKPSGIITRLSPWN